jgi:hypothetical protein
MPWLASVHRLNRLSVKPTIHIALHALALGVSGISQPAIADEVYRQCGSGHTGYIRNRSKLICIKSEEAANKSQQVRDTSGGTPGGKKEIVCGTNGWCNIGTSGDRTWQVKMFNATGNTRSAYLNGEGTPTTFDCAANQGKRIRYADSAKYNPILPGTMMEEAYDYVCGQ